MDQRSHLLWRRSPRRVQNRHADEYCSRLRLGFGRVSCRILRLFTDAYTVPLSRDDDDRAVYYTAYQNIIKFVPGLNNLIALNRDGDLESLHKYIDIVRCFSSHTSY
jgi:hypothetical protein